MKNYEMEEGDSAIFNCEVNSNHAAYIYWYRIGMEGRTMVGSGNILNLHNLSRTDAALYQCQAENDLGLSKFVTHNLHIFCKY